MSQELRFASPSDRAFPLDRGCVLIARTDSYPPVTSSISVRRRAAGEADAAAKLCSLRELTFLADSQDNTAWAFFGEASYDVTDRLEASFALRYDNDDRGNTTETPP